MDGLPYGFDETDAHGIERLIVSENFPFWYWGREKMTEISANFSKIPAVGLPTWKSSDPANKVGLAKLNSGMSGLSA
tara:strand:+ start:263 stop:493 length:231 start_codon:yes stop_codon:yes gene_type:complete